MTSLVFIHGRHAERGDWVGGIRAALEQTGRGRLADETDIVEVDYADVLHSVTAEERRSQAGRARADHNPDHHRVVRASLSDFTQRPRSPYDFAPKEWVTRQIMNRMPEIERYRREPEVRNAVRHRVLDQLPSGKAVIIGHSLGSVVAFDLMQYLPDGLDVELLLTIGSPMARRPWRTCLAEYRGRYPTGAARSWVNIVNRGDWVTAGDGIHLFFPQAIDVYARLGLGVHGETPYLTSTPAGVAIGDALARSSVRTTA